MLHIITKIENGEHITPYPKIFIKFNYNYNEDFSDELSKKVIKEIDNADIIQGPIVKTPFGLTTIDMLSTGCQSLLLAIKEKDNDIWVNFCSAGNNVVELALKLCKDLNLDLYIYYNNYTCIKGKYDFEIDGKVYINELFTITLNNIVSNNDNAEGGGY